MQLSELPQVQPQGGALPRQEFILHLNHHTILVAVHKFHLLTNIQIGAACGYSPKSLKKVQYITKQLVDNGYLLAFPRPVTTGKAPLVYALARKGMNYLKDAGFNVREYFRPSQEQEKSYLFLAHTLAVNDVLIAASRLYKHTASYTLAQFTHERVLKQNPYKVAVTHDNGTKTLTLIPDAYLLFVEHKESGKKEQIPVLLELDRNTVEQKPFRRNLRARIEFIKEEGYKSYLETHTVRFAYIAAEGGEKHRDQMRKWARKEMAATLEKGWLSSLFLFTSLPRPINPVGLFVKPCWYTPFDDNSPLSLLAK